MLDEERRTLLKRAGLAVGAWGAAAGALAQTRVAGPDQPPDGAPVRLSLNENPFGPAPSVIAAVQAELTRLSRYTDRGYDELVDLIAAHERVPREQIVLGEILEPLGTHLSLQGGRGGEFLHSDPGYTALVDAAAAVGGSGVAVPLDAQLRNDLAAIAARVSERTRAVFLVNPHNPTGIVSDAEELRGFARATSQRTLVIVDEAYLEFAGNPAQRSLVDLVRAGANVIVFRTFAKAHGLAGLDIGYGLVPREIARTLHAQGLDNPHLFNRLAVAAAAASLKDPAHLARSVQQVAGEREQWLAFLHELQLRSTPSSANFVFFETGREHAAFAAAMLREGVQIGRLFRPYDRWARVSIGLPGENALARDAVRKVLEAGKA